MYIPFILETARLLAALIRRRRAIPMILGIDKADDACNGGIRFLSLKRYKKAVT